MPAPQCDRLQSELKACAREHSIDTPVACREFREKLSDARMLNDLAPLTLEILPALKKKRLIRQFRSG